jgi:hypothetical protein
VSEPVRMPLENGAILEFHDLSWTPTGRLFCQVIGYAPDMLAIGSSKVEMSNSSDRYRVAREFSSHNGAKPDIWADALLSAWLTLDEQHRSQRAAFAPVDLSQFEDPPSLGDVWQGLITSKLIATLYGDSGQGKSTLVDGLATSISLGRPFLGRAVTPGPVIILDWELSQDLTLHRLYRIARGVGLTTPPPIMYQSLYGPLTAYLPDILAWCERVNPVLIVVDSMGPACGGDPLNAERAIALMNALRQLPISPLVVDHQSNPIQGQAYGNKREFGTSYKRHLTRSSLQVEMVNNEAGKASIILRQQKDNFGPKSDPLPFHILYEGDAIRFEVADILDVEFQEVETLPADRRIEKFLNETRGATQKNIMAECNIPNDKTFANNMTKLKKRRKVEVSRMPNSQERWYFFEP